MLEVLRIKNVAIIDTVEIQFKSGLNILSGETGAGKSIIIEAISLLLGSRASSELVRSGCEEAVIEGVFNISEIPWMNPRLEQAGFQTQAQELLIKRTVHRSGRHRISINGELATLSSLQSLCEGLIDLCGQHEHQSLLKLSTQLELIDRYGALTEQSKKMSDLWHEFKSLSLRYLELQKAAEERMKRSSFLEFQIEEIQNAQPQCGEDEALQREKQLLQSAESRVKLAESIRQWMDSDDAGILNSLKHSLQKMRVLTQLDPSAQSISASLERAFIEMEEASLLVDRYLNSIDLDPERLQQIQDRLSVLADLKRKYGSQISEILNNLSLLQAELSSLDTVEDQLTELDSRLKEQQTQILKLGKKLSSSRKKSAQLLSTQVTQELKDLKMGEAEFKAELSSKDQIEEWGPTGADQVQFIVRTNRGELARPIGKVASGGELSRLMLAIRRVIANQGGIGVYLFDEIDSGIGGQTAFQVGKKLKSVASYNQVICITHLAQVASFADHHWIVKKVNQGKRTLTQIEELTSLTQKEEIARMLGGPVLTQKSIENASELLELARH